MDNRNTKDGILQVKMFGEFSVIWDGKTILGGSKRKETQFAGLMQMILHYRGTGITRAQLEENLFADRDVNNAHHSLRSVLYNTRRRLRDSGLPDVQYFLRSKGKMHWTSEVPVKEDAAEFEALYSRAQKIPDREERLGCLLEAAGLYDGDFLQEQAGMLWVAEEARRYRAMFSACVEEAAGLLRAAEDYPQLEKLGLHAARVQPLADWETLIMEALIAQNRIPEARRLYDHTVDYYYREEGLKPSERMLKMLDGLGGQIRHGHAALDQIQAGLVEPDGEIRGGYFCPYPVFQGIYRMVGRMMERGGQSVYLMLCSLVDQKGNPMKEGAILEKMSPRLLEAVCASVRHGDAVARYGLGQYVILLVNTNREDCEKIQQRISHRFTTGRQRIGIAYFVSSVDCPGSANPV